MKIYRLLFLLPIFLLAQQGRSQNIGTVNLSTTLVLEESIPLSGGGYLAFGMENTAANRVLTRFDADWVPLWSHSFPYTSVLGTRKMVELNDGNYAFLFTTTSNGGSAAVMKLDPQGNILQVREYQFTTGSMDAFALAPAAPGDNGYILGGGQCAWENYLIKCNEDGSVAWCKSYDDLSFSGVQTVWEIMPSASGYTVGSSYSLSGLDASLFRVDTAGTLQWCYQYPLANSDERPRTMLTQSTGTIVLHCATDLEGDEDIVHFINPNGTLIGTQNYVGTISVDLTDMAIDANDELYFVGTHSAGANTGKLVAMKTDAVGTPIWSKFSKITTNAVQSYGNQLELTASGNLAILARTVGFQQLGTLSVIDPSGAGFCVEEATTVTNPGVGLIPSASKNLTTFQPQTVVVPVTVTPTAFAYNTTTKCGSIVGTESPASQSFSLAPNPGQGKLQVRTGQPWVQASIEVFSANGQRVQLRDGLGGVAAELDLSGLPAGMYWVRVTDGAAQASLPYQKL